MQTDQWYPAAAPEKNVWGRFEWFESPDGPYNVEQSHKENRKVPLRVIILRMKTAAGDGETCVPVKPFNQADLAKRFPDAWAAFNGEHVEVSGTSLDELGLAADDLLRLRMFGIHNAEMLAAVPDAGCGALGFGWLAKRDAAKGLIEAKKNAAVDELIETAKRKPGRPKKTDAAVQTAA